MKGYFARHRGDKKAKGWGDNNNPSPGYIAWLLWGGDAGDRWAKKTWAKMQRVKKNPEGDMAVEALTIVEGPMANFEENPGPLDWMRNRGINPAYVGVGALVGALFDRSLVWGGLKGALVVAGLSYICAQSRR
jgi:hypothetical protein